MRKLIWELVSFLARIAGVSFCVTLIPFTIVGIIYGAAKLIQYLYDMYPAPTSVGIVFLVLWFLVLIFLLFTGKRKAK